jgi:proteasome accessory factor C
MAAADQLERILYIIPRAAGEQGASLAELARALEVDEATIMRDLEEATARVYYQPAGNVDPFDIFLDGERVRVHAPHDFKRPVRLNAREGMALELGLRVLAADLGGERRQRALALAEQLSSQVAAPELTLQPALARRAETAAPDGEAAIDVDIGEDEVRGVVADAITRGRLCVLTYLKPGEAPAERRVAPRRLIYASGQWYVAAQDVTVGEDRHFRLDRVLRAQVLNEPVPALGEPPAAFSFESDGAELEARVRYSPRVARWIAEDNNVECEPDGSLVLTHKVADPQWLVRHVLQYGGEAVVETPSLRRMVAEAAARALAV